jgi:hypothetical protein
MSGRFQDGYLDLCRTCIELFDPGRAADLQGAVARPLGDPASGGDSAKTIAFSGGRASRYEYAYPLPDAQMGIRGRVVVR